MNKHYENRAEGLITKLNVLIALTVGFSSLLGGIIRGRQVLELKSQRSLFHNSQASYQVALKTKFLYRL